MSSRRPPGVSHSAKRGHIRLREAAGTCSRTLIEKTAAQLFTEAAQDKGAFHERSARSLQRVGGKLQDWNKDGSRSAVLQRLKRQLDGVCAGVDSADGQRAACDSVLKPRSAG